MLPHDNTCNDYCTVNWKGLLGGNKNPPQLSFAKSESRFLSSDAASDIFIQCYWDIDSFFTCVMTLAAHKHGFWLSYLPFFLHHIQQPSHITINGVVLHKVKHLHLSNSVAEAGYNMATYILFPHLPIDGPEGTTHLNCEQQAIWIDEIIWPALLASCSHHILQHHPQSFLDAECKSQVKQEAYLWSTGQPINVQYSLPAHVLHKFWVQVQQFAWQHIQFCQPVLMVMGHNLKLLTQWDSSTAMRADFLDWLEYSLNMQEVTMPQNDAWVDLGIEDVPLNDGITLLQKTPCLQSWMSQFCCPCHSLTQCCHQRPQHCIKTAHFPFMMTWDAGSVTVTLSTLNTLCREGGIAHNKAYNINKDLFTTPFKPYNTFHNAYLETLSFMQKHQECWQTVNQCGVDAFPNPDVPPTLYKHEDVVRSFMQAKHQVVASLREAMEAKLSFDVRQEFCIHFSLLRKLSMNMDREAYTLNPPAASPAEGVASISTSAPQRDSPLMLSTDNILHHSPKPEQIMHQPFFILSTTDVHKFISATINWWIFCLEALASRAI